MLIRLSTLTQCLGSGVAESKHPLLLKSPAISNTVKVGKVSHSFVHSSIYELLLMDIGKGRIVTPMTE